MTTFDLFSSVRDGNTDIVRRLLQSRQCRARLNDRNEWGDTALHLASEAGNAEICQMLIAAGASVTVRNNRGETCLHRAAVGGHMESVRAIVGECTYQSVLPAIELHCKRNGSTEESDWTALAVVKFVVICPDPTLPRGKGSGDQFLIVLSQQSWFSNEIALRHASIALCHEDVIIEKLRLLTWHNQESTQ